MLTYNLSQAEGPLYKALYQFIRSDIQQGKLKAHEKMPSKRMLAKNLGISTISIENAYDQLICEGYLYSIPKRGYFVSQIENLNHNVSHKKTFPQFSQFSQPLASSLASRTSPVLQSSQDSHISKTSKEPVFFDFSSNRIENTCFPFSIWAKIVRETISQREKELLEVSPYGGVWELRQAIADHLESFRGMCVNPEQIIVGAGTEYLYGLLIKLLGPEKKYCIENPGYKKLKLIYESNNATCIPVDMDAQGISVSELQKLQGQIAHISPTHHFPTGICMPASRRYEMLAWANQTEDHYIIEDDYDSEFRLKGKPIPSLYSMDVSGKVIYMNTFSKSLTSTIRISYMILPEQLADIFNSKLSFYSCTISTFEQYSLATFINQGYFEKHINRMRLHYGRKRSRVMEVIKNVFSNDQCKIIENDSGLHFILEFKTDLSDSRLKNLLQEKGIIISSITDFEMKQNFQDKHQFILNYSNIETDQLKNALMAIKKLICL